MDKTKVKRVPKRGYYDRETIYAILDRNYYCHVGFMHEDYPVVIPTAYGRVDDVIYLHGSAASRMMKDLSTGIDVCVTVSKMTGFVLAKSLFHHSMNYESVVIFGKAQLVVDNETKLAALKAFTDHVLPGRWEEARKPNEKEMKGTSVLKLNISEASAKIRNEGASDDKSDEELDIWTGVIPIIEEFGNPVLDAGKPYPESVNNILDK